MLNAVLDYHRKGFRPIPIPPGAKGPELKGWKTLDLDELGVRYHFGNGSQNVGLLLGEPAGYGT
jgi:hypothetical protein